MGVWRCHRGCSEVQFAVLAAGDQLWYCCAVTTPCGRPRLSVVGRRFGAALREVWVVAMVVCGRMWQCVRDWGSV